jgi:hypothetical protein
MFHKFALLGLSLLPSSFAASSNTLENLELAQAQHKFMTDMRSAAREKNISLTVTDFDRFNRDLYSKSIPVSGGGVRRRAAEDDDDDAYADDQYEGDDAAMNEADDDKYMDFNNYYMNQNANKAADDDELAEVNDDESSGHYFSSLSFKYHSCASLSGFYNDGEDGFTSTSEKFVAFRLCNSKSCQDDSWNGCRTYYGEYLVKLDEYLQSMFEYQREVFKDYCSYCYNCLVYEKMYGGQCELHDACQNYGNVCSAQDMNENGNNYMYKNFFECQEVQYDGYTFYVGPHCDASKSSDFFITVFSDAQCTQYIGDSVSVDTITGMSISNNKALSSLYSHNCVSCNINNIPYYTVGQNKENGMYDYDSGMWSWEYDANDDGILDMCQELFESSAKCNYRLPHAEKLMSYNEEQGGDEYYQNEEYQVSSSESATCSYIDDVVRGYISKQGYVGKEVSIETEVTFVQGVALFIGAIGCIVMFGWALLLRQGIKRHVDMTLLNVPLSTPKTDDFDEIKAARSGTMA